MANEDVNIKVKLKGTADANKRVGRLGKAFNKLKQNAKMVAIAGIGLLAAAIKKTTKLFGVQEKAVKQMEAALKATGQEVKENSKDLQAYASELQRVTTVGDEVSLQVMQMGLNMGLSAKQTKEATKQSIGLSKAYGVDMKAAMKAVAAAQKGDYNMLNRYIPSLRSFKDETLKATEAKRLLSAAFEVAKAETQTLDGAMQQMSNALGDAGEQIGAVFAPMLQKAAVFVRELAERFQALSPQTQKMTVVISTITIALLALLPVLAMVATSIAAISWPVLAVVAAVGLATIGFIKLKGSIQQAGSITTWLTNNFITMGQIITGQIKRILEQFNGFLKLLSKIPGVDINVDSAIEAMDRLDARMEAQKEKNIERTQSENERKAEQEAIEEEKRQVKIEKEDGDRAVKKEKDVVDAQEKLALESKTDKTALKQKKITSDAQKKLDETRAQNFNSSLGFMAQGMQSKNKEIFAIGKAASIAQATMSGVEAVNKALASAPPPFNFALAAAVGAVAVDNVNRIASTQLQLAEGGIVQPQPGGVSATIAEAGSAEAVIPLDSDEGQGMLGGNTQVDVYISGKPLAKEMYETQQEMIRTGELEA